MIMIIMMTKCKRYPPKTSSVESDQSSLQEKQIKQIKKFFSQNHKLHLLTCYTGFILPLMFNKYV